MWTRVSTQQPDVDGVPLPVCVHPDGTVTRVLRTAVLCSLVPGPPRRCLAGRSTAHWMGGSPSAGWTGTQVREAGPAALWASASHPRSPQRGRPFRTPAICRPGGLASGLQPRRGNGGGAGPGRDRGRRPRAGAAGRPGVGASSCRHPPPALEPAFRAGLHVCARVCTRVCVRLRARLGPLSRTPRSLSRPFPPPQEHGGDWAGGLMRRR